MKPLLEIVAFVLVVSGLVCFWFGWWLPFGGLFLGGFFVAVLAQLMRDPGRDDWDPWRWVIRDRWPTSL